MRAMRGRVGHGVNKVCQECIRGHELCALVITATRHLLMDCN